MGFDIDRDSLKRDATKKNQKKKIMQMEELCDVEEPISGCLIFPY